MLLFLPLLIPFCAAVAALLSWRWVGVQRVLSLIGACALLGVGGVILRRVLLEGPFAQQAGGWPAPFGITLIADGLSAVMVVLTGVVAVATGVFAWADVRRDEAHHGYFPLCNALLAGVCGAFLTGDLFNMYVWFEVMLIASFGLLVIGGGREALDGALKYAELNLIGTVAFISGVGLLYGTTGALNMADLHVRLIGREGETAVLVSAAFLVFAFGSKAALFPAFFWLPASYHTPSFTTSALFAGLLTKVGVYALIRVFTLVYDLDGTPVQTALLWGAVLTMGVGALGALVQGSVRRVLNFGILSSIGAMVLGLALHTPLALLGAVFYMAQDVIVKANLYLMAGGVARLAGSEEFARAGGLWRARPWFGVLFLIPALSLAGVPPFAGFWGKLLLARATLEIGAGGLTFVVLAVGLLTLLAMARIWAEVFWKAHPLGDGAVEARLPVAVWGPLVGLSALLVGIGIGAAPFIAAGSAVAAGLLDPAAYLAAVAR